MSKDRKEEGNVPNLRFPKFEGEWKEKKLGEICKFVRGPFGSALKKEFFINDGYAVYEQSHAIHNNFNSFRYYISEEKFNSLRRFSVEPKDIIMSCSGTMGKFAIIPEESKKGVINQALLKLTSKENFNHKFIKIALELPQIQNKLLSQSAGGAIKNVVGIPQLKEIGLYIPKLIEQNKISTFFSLLDQRIETQSKIIEELKLLKSTISNKIFTQGIRFKNNNGSRYTDWIIGTIGDVCLVVMGQSPSSSSYNSVGKGLPLIQGNTDISDRITVPKNWTTEKTKECKIGDLILTVRAPVDAVAKSMQNACIGRGVCAISPSLDTIDIDYIYQFLLYYENKWSALEQGSTFASVSKNEIDKIKLSYPSSTKEQSKIIHSLSSIDKIIEMEVRLLELYNAQKQYLLQEMFI